MASDIQAVIEGPASDGSSSSSGEQSGVGRRGTRRGPGAGHGGPEAAGGSEGTPPENKLFRVEDFMQTFVKQEATMWQKGCLFSSSSLAESTLASADSYGSTTTLPGSRALSLAGGEDEDNLTMVRYGKMSDEVHKYFKKLEKSHACMHLTGRKANFDNFRLPPLDGLLVAIQSNAEEVPAAEASINQQPLVTLREEELSLYQCALMCAQFPMLSAPGPPDGSSPTPVPPELPLVMEPRPSTAGTVGVASADRHEVAGGMQQVSPLDVICPMSMPSDGVGVGLLGGGASSIKGGVLNGVGTMKAETGKGRMKVASKSSEPRRCVSESDDVDEELMKLDSKPIKGGNREQPFTPMVNREMLCSLVRRAFLQTEEQQVQHEHILRHEHGRRSKGEILAKELVCQLQVLENNAHQFYKPKLFVTRNGYDLWLQSEKQRIKALIDKFWHYSLPRPPQASRLYTTTVDYHRAYANLLQKIICCESQTERKEPAHLGRTPSSPLSPTACRLLLEFSLRYGVGELFCKIVYLDYLARHFDYEVWYIKHCTEELRSIRDFFPVNKNKNIAVKKEMDMLRSSVHLLHGQTDNSLTRIDRLFLDSDPVKGVTALIELLKEVLDAEQSLFGKKVRSVEDWLKRYLKSGFELRYERQKEIASDEVIPDRAAKPFVLTPVLINALLLAIREEVHYYRENFQGVFRPYFDIVPFAQQEFYRLVCTDAVSLAQRMIHAPETRLNLSLEMLGLMYRLNERDNEWKGVVLSERQNQSWRRQFTLLALIWMDVLGKQVNQWVLTAVSLDDWSLLSFKEHHFVMNQPNGFCAKMTSSVRHTSSSSELPLTPSLTRPIGGKGSAFTAYKSKAPKAVVSLTDIMSEHSGSVSEWSSQGGSVDSDNLLDTTTEALVQQVHASSSPSSRSSSSDSVLLKFPHADMHARAAHVHTRAHASGDVDHSSQVLNNHPVEEDAAVGRTPPPPQQTSRDVGTPLVQASGGGTPLVQASGDGTPLVRASGGGTPLVQASGDGTPLVQASGGGTTLLQASGDGTPLVQASGDGTPLVQASIQGLTGGSPVKPPDVEGTPIQMTGSDPQRTTTVHPIGTTSPQGTTIGTTSLCEVTVQPIETTNSQGATIGTTNPLGATNGTPNPQGATVQPIGISPSDSRSSTPALALSVEVTNKLQMSDITRASTPSLLQSHRSLLEMSATHESLHKGASALETPCNVPEDVTPRQGGQDVAPRQGGHDVAPGEHIRTMNTNNLWLEKVFNEEDKDGTLTPVPSPSLDGDERLYTFPVSNSVVDLVGMLTRVACFTGTILEVLTPKTRLGVTRLEREKVTQELPSEVSQAKQLVVQQQRDAENTKFEFMKKLHKVMIGAMRLYADNLTCMDLCCCTVLEAKQYLGEQMVYHLKRRKEEGQIWGCRHTIEERSGLHPNGLPCHKKGKVMFDNITRDMCIRMNDIHLLTSIFPSLESHLHSSMHVIPLKQVTAFGYISGDGSPLLHGHVGERSSHRGTTSSSLRDTGSSWVSTEPEGSAHRPHIKGESGFGSAESEQFLEYLRNVHSFQVQVLCVRMNQFIKPAISVLLGLKLPNGTVEKRFAPLLSFVGRHCAAFEKCLYPECFGAVLQCLWKLLVKDLEAEAVMLRTLKDPVTEKARLLLHLTSLLMSLLHKKGGGVSLEILTSSSEYLLGVLDIMTKSTDQLISAFHKLSTFRIARSRLEVTKSLLYIDQAFLHSVRSHLHTYKKCFQGRDFVNAVVTLGGKAHSPVLQSASTRQAEVTPLVRPTVYTVQYAADLAHHLIQQGALIEILQGDHSAYHIPTSVRRSDDAALGSSLVSSSLERGGAVNTAGMVEEGVARAPPTSFQGLQQPAHGATQFAIEAWYRFADAEDSNSRALYASQVLSASTVPAGTGDADFSQDMDKARGGSLFLVCDLLLQRSKERAVKQFLQSPSARNVLERRRTEDTACDYIFKL